MSWRTFRNMHPAVLVTAACFIVLLLTLSHAGRLLGLSAACVVVACGYCRDQFARLVRRMSILLMILCIVMLWQTPGSLVLPRWNGFSPTYEGFLLAGEQAARLLSNAAVVAVLMHRMRPAEVAAGLVGLLTPMSYLGLDTRRMAIRIQLVLDAVARPSPLAWREIVSGVCDTVTPVRVELIATKIRMQDVAWMALMGLLLLGGLLW